MNINILDFLMENDVVIVSPSTGYEISADEAYILGGEFTVTDGGKLPDLYRGTDFEEAMKVLLGDDE